MNTHPRHRDLAQVILAAGGVPIVALKRPRCPRCRTLNKSPYRSDRDGETVTQRRRCHVCGLKFVTISD